MSDNDEKVAYEISFDLVGPPRGGTVQVPGLGTFENGKTYEVTKAEADAYRSFHTRQTPIVDDETKEIRGTEAELGPTLLQAFKKLPFQLMS